MFFTDGFPLSTARLSAKRTFADDRDLPTAWPSAKESLPTVGRGRRQSVTLSTAYSLTVGKH
jgi:hypothetical protein